MEDYISQLESMECTIEELERGFELLKKLDDLQLKSKEPPYLTTNLDDFVQGLTRYDELLIEKSQPHYNALKKEKGTTPTHIRQFEPIPTKPEHRTSIASLIEKYLHERSKNTRQSTINGYQTHLNTLVGIVDIEWIDELSPDILRGFKDSLAKIPPRHKVNKKYKNKTIKQVLEMVDDNTETIGDKTIDDYLTTIRSFLKWMLDNQYITTDFTTILKFNRKKKPQNKETAVFTTDDLNKIFSIKEFQTTESHKRPFRYWIPLIMMFTGARTNEVSQLRTSDIRKTTEEIWYFDFNDDGNSQIKTQSGIRQVPIHKTLIELGFIKYFESLESNILLFSDLKPDRDGKYYRKVSKFFNESYRGKNGVLDFVGINKQTREGRKVMYSFRHTFINAMKQMLMDPQVVKEICGHEKNDVTYDRYGEDLDPKTLKKEIDKVQFDCKLPPPW
jgi:integrase